MAIKIFIKKSDIMIVAKCQLLVIPTTPLKATMSAGKSCAKVYICQNVIH